MAWEDVRFVLLEDEQLKQKEIFDASGWMVYGLAEVQDNQDTFINAYWGNPADFCSAGECHFVDRRRGARP